MLLATPQQNHASPKLQQPRTLPDDGHKGQVDGHIGRGAEQERGEARVDGAGEHGRSASQCASRNMKGMLRSLSHHLAHSGPESKHVRRPSPLGTPLVSCAFVQRAKRPRTAILESQFMIVPLMKLLWAGTKLQLVLGWWFEIFHPS